MDDAKPKKSQSIFLILIILLSIFLIRNALLSTKVQYSGDSRDQFLADILTIRKSLFSGNFPLWNPFLMSGEPLFPKPQLGVISLNTLIEFISPNVYVTNSLNILIHLILFGIGMYFLCRTLNLEPRYSFISAIVGMFSTYITRNLFFGTFQFMGVSIIPYVLLFTIKATKNKHWIRYGILAGFFLGFEFLEGAFEVFTFTAMIVSYILFFNIIGKSFLNRAVKPLLIGVLILIITLGISAIKLLPAIEFVNSANRQQPFDCETSLGVHLTLDTFFKHVIDSRNIQEPFKYPIKGEDSLALGLITFILILFSIFNIRKKNYLMFFGMAIFGLLMITDSILVRFLWEYFPYFNKQKHVIKAQVIFFISACVLSAYGVYYIISKIKDKKIANITYTIIVILLIITSWGFAFDIKLKSPYKELESVEIMKYMSNDKDMFRFKAWETNGIDWGTNYYSTYYGLQDIYGYVNLWSLEYLPIFLSVANREPAKFFGMLNMKYMTSMDEINISGFKLIKKFDDMLKNCKYINGDIIDFYGMPECPAQEPHKKAWGPYLYLNERFMPRAYLVDDAILIVGNKEQVKQIAYTIMLDERFEPEKSVVILGKARINDYSLEELNRYSVVILAEGSIEQNSFDLLKGFKDNRGLILPDIINGKNTITGGDIEDMWKRFTGNYTRAEYKEINYNHYKANLHEKEKFLVLSERFFLYHGWIAKAENKKLEILNANVMNSAVYTSDKAEIDFIYLPESFVRGAWISIITALVCCFYLGYSYIIKSRF